MTATKPIPVFRPGEYLLACLTIELERVLPMPYQKSPEERDADLLRFYASLSLEEAKVLSDHLQDFAQRQAAHLTAGEKRRLADQGPNYSALVKYLLSLRDQVLLRRPAAQARWQDYMRSLKRESFSQAMQHKEDNTMILTLEENSAACLGLAAERFCLRSGSLREAWPILDATIEFSDDPKAPLLVTMWQCCDVAAALPGQPAFKVSAMGLEGLQFTCTGLTLLAEPRDYRHARFFHKMEFQPWYRVAQILLTLQERQNWSQIYKCPELALNDEEQQLLKLLPLFSPVENMERSPFYLWNQGPSQSGEWQQALQQLSIFIAELPGTAGLQVLLQKALKAGNMDQAAVSLRKVQGYLLSQKGQTCYLRLTELSAAAAAGTATIGAAAFGAGIVGAAAFRALCEELDLALHAAGWDGHFPYYHHLLSAERSYLAAALRKPLEAIGQARIDEYALLELRWDIRVEGMYLQFLCAATSQTIDFDHWPQEAAAWFYPAWQQRRVYMADFAAPQLALERSREGERMACFAELEEKLPLLLSLFQGELLDAEEKALLSRHLTERKRLRLAAIVVLAVTLGLLFLLAMWFIPPAFAALVDILAGRGRMAAWLSFCAIFDSRRLLGLGLYAGVFTFVAGVLLYLSERKYRD